MRETKGPSLDAILENFDVNGECESEGDTTLTVWVPMELKERYRELQKRSNRRFSGTLRKVVEAAIEKADKKVS